MLVSLVIFGAVIAVLRVVLLKPMKLLNQSVSKIASAQYETTVPGANKSDELGQLATNLEQMRLTLAQNEGVKAENAFKGAAFSGASAAMMIVDGDARIINTNEKMREIFAQLEPDLQATNPGFSAANLIGSSIDSFHPGRNGDGFRKILQSTVQAPYKLIMTIGNRPDFGGDQLRLKDAAGALLGNVAEWADVTQQYLNDAILEAINTNQLRAEFDTQGRLLAANPSFHGLFALDAAQLAGRPLSTLLDHGSHGGEEDNLVGLVMSSHCYLGKFYFGAGRDVKIVDGSLSTVHDQNGQVIRLLLVGKDVTVAEQSLTEARDAQIRIEQQQNQVVDTLRVALRTMSQGDLTARIEDPFEGSYEELRHDYNSTLEVLSRIIRDVIENAESIRNEARDISGTTETLSRRTESTAATLEETAAALDGLTKSVRAPPLTTPTRRTRWFQKPRSTPNKAVRLSCKRLRRWT